MKILLKYLKPYKSNLIIGPFFKLLEAIIEILLPIIIAFFIDNYNSFSSGILILYSILLSFLAILGLIFACICQYIASITSQRYSKSLRDALFSHIQNISSIDLNIIGTSSTVNRIINDVNNLEISVSMFIRLLIRVPFIFIGSIVMIALIDKTISVIVLVSSIILFILVLFIIKSASFFYTKANFSLDSLTSKVKENLNNIKLIRSFSTEAYENSKFKQINNSTYLYNKISNILSFLLNPISIFIFNLTILIVFGISNIKFNLGFISKGEIIAVINYISEMLFSVTILSNLIAIYAKCFSSGKRIIELFKLKPKEHCGHITKFSPSNNVYDIQNLSFSYSTINTLSHISLKILPGEIIGIIGITGSGKTTFLKLLSNNLSTFSGNLQLYGKNINEYNFNFLRENITYISQKADFITNTIYENVALGRNTTKEEVVKSLELSSAINFVKDKSLNLVLKNNASNLSGGQKQRINIARAFIGNPRILIFDDVTSSLDLYTEAQILKNIFIFSKQNNITTFISSQKTSTIQNCDKIIVFNDGKIEDIGTHKELLKISKLYNKIYNLQSSAN